jgi:hypothetical protein
VSEQHPVDADLSRLFSSRYTISTREIAEIPTL